MEFNQFLVEHKPQNSLKSQVLSDFITECQFSKPIQITDPEHSKSIEKWSLYVDGASTSNSSGAEVVLINPKGFTLKMAVKVTFEATNNEAE